MEHLQFYNGQLYPALGFGTYQRNLTSSRDPEFEAAFEAALEAGYRHFDTAYFYQNEKIIGNILKKWISSGKIRRDDIFLVTKLPPQGMTPEGVKKFSQLSLNDLQLDYIDLYLIHIPIGFKDIEGKMEIDKDTDHVAIWKEMENLVENGKVKSIGLSNFNISQISKIQKNAKIQPANLQIELHAAFQQNELVDFCKKSNIVVTAYCPLGCPSISNFYAEKYGMRIEEVHLLTDPIVNSISKKYNKTPAQILLKQIVQRGIAAIPKSSNLQRLKENINIFDFNLDENDMKQLAALDKEKRMVEMLMFEGILEHPEYPFVDVIRKFKI